MNIYSLDFSSCDNNNASSPVTNAHLKYLSSQQAQHDIKMFVERMNKQHRWVTSDDNRDDTNNGNGNDGNDGVKWVTFGGSYPGMMAAWARLLFPDLIFASVSNSAPVQVVLNFEGYKEWVGQDLAYTRIGGSEACFARVREGHEQILQKLLYNDDSYDEVAELFQICGGGDSLRHSAKNVDMWVGDGVIEIPAQEDDPVCEGDVCNIAKVCEHVLKGIEENKTSMESLAVVASMQTSKLGGGCTNVDWNSTLDFFSSMDAQEGGIRSWTWQTCNEMGFYQTCLLNTSCPFGRGHYELSMDLEICDVAFGVKPDQVASNVQETLERYGGWHLNATRILSVNGDVDPWSDLAVTDGKGNSNLPTHWVPGASHHFWTHKVQSSDSKEVMAARQFIYDTVLSWIGADETAGITVAET